MESPLPIGPEWRKGEELSEGPQVNISCAECCKVKRGSCSCLIVLHSNVFSRVNVSFMSNLGGR